MSRIAAFSAAFLVVLFFAPVQGQTPDPAAAELSALRASVKTLGEAVERLKAENAALKAELAQAKDRADKADAELARLKAAAAGPVAAPPAISAPPGRPSLSPAEAAYRERERQKGRERVLNESQQECQFAERTLKALKAGRLDPRLSEESSKEGQTERLGAHGQVFVVTRATFKTQKDKDDAIADAQIQVDLAKERLAKAQAATQPAGTGR